MPVAGERVVGGNGTLLMGVDLDGNAQFLRTFPDGTLLSAHALCRDAQQVPQSQTDKLLGATGAKNDYLDSLIIVPITATPGAVTIRDGASGPVLMVLAGGSAGGQNSFGLFIGLPSKNNGWRITTGLNVSVIAKGRFT